MKKMPLFTLTGALIMVTGLLMPVFQKDPAALQSGRLVQARVGSENADKGFIPVKNSWTPAQVPQRPLIYAPVGKVTLYGNAANPQSLVLFLSGDGGWNAGAQKMAVTLAQDGQTLVVGIDLPVLYKKLDKKSGKCIYPAGILENLSEFVQKEISLTDYQKPVLTGYSAGATLVYGLLCQAPAGTFRGGIALGFCSDAELPGPLCEGSGKIDMAPRKDGKGYEFTSHPVPATLLEVLNGVLDKDCGYDQTRDFFENVENVEVVALPKAGHGFSIPSSWLPQFRQAFSRILAATDPNSGMLLPAVTERVPVAMAGMGNFKSASGDLPLFITPAGTDNSAPMVLFLSGDGGWTGFDREICDQLAARHLPTVGLNSQSYFWKKKTPEQTVNDLSPVIRRYLHEWNRSTCILVGYSFGAGIAPFIHNRLPADLRGKISKIVLLSPDPKCDFEIHVAGMLGHGGGPYDVVAEVRSLQNMPVLCVTGDEEGNEMQAALQGVQHVQFAKIPGSHHYNNDAVRVANTIL
jgi:type IV secretory pathway VirJ component